MSEVKAYLHVVYAGFGDASILEFHSGDKRELYLVDGGPVRYVVAGGTQHERVKKLTKLQLSRPYYQYLLYTLTALARIPNSTGLKLNGAVVTHPHADHLDGVERLFRELLPHKYQESIKPDSPDKRLMCNGPVLLTRKFAQEDEAYRSFSEFLLTTKFEISLDKDDIQNAFGNDIVFTFPSSPSVLYHRVKPSEDDEPFSEEKQRNKLKGGDEDDDLNKSSIILYIAKGGKICLSGDAYGYDIIAMLRKEGVKNLDIFKLPHHGSRHNSILRTVLPPPWVFQNLASMLLLSLSLNIKNTFDKSTEEENDIDYLSHQLKRMDGDGNGEKVQQVAEAFLKELTARIKNVEGKITPEILFKKIQEKHIEIVSALQHQPCQIDPCKNMKPLKPLQDWQTLTERVTNKLMFCRFSTTTDSEGFSKARKVGLSTFVGDLMGNNTIYRDFFAAKIGIDKFFESFDSKTYYVAASGRYDHPSTDVIKGIIKAAVKKKKACRIVFTSGGAVPSKHLPDVQEEHYKEWNKLVSLYYLKSDVSFKLDPSSDANVAPEGTAKFESEDKVRIDIAAQLKKNFGFTIPRRSFLSTLDKYCVKTEISDKKFHWLRIKPDGTLFLTSTKSDQNVLFVSNAPSINGDLRMITLKSESKDGAEKNVWLEKATKGGFLLKCSAHGDYLFYENGSLSSGNEKNNASCFFFDHTTFSGQLKSGKEVPIVEFLRSFGYKGGIDQSIHVRSVLEILLGMRNIKWLIEVLPDGFIGIVALDQLVNLTLSTVELSSSLDCEVVSSHIEVILATPSITFDSHKVTKLQVVVKERCSNSPRLSLLISTSLRDTIYTVHLSENLKPREPTVDMYLNALGGVPLEGRNNMTLGTLLVRVMGLLPLEALSDCFQAQLLAHEIFTWKVDRALSTVNYFISPVAVEVLSGDLYVNIPPKMNRLAFGGKLTADLSTIHVMVNNPRTYKSDFAIECDASIGSVPVSLKMACTSTSVPEVIITFPESVDVATVFKTLGLPANLHELTVPLVNKVIKNLVLSKPRISVVQDVPSSKLTHISSVCFEFSFDNLLSFLPSGLPVPQGSRAIVSICNPLSQQLQVGVEVEFNLPVSSSASTENNSFLKSKLSLWPVEVSDLDSQRSYSCSISMRPGSSEISIQSALQAIGLGELAASMTSSFPCISSMLTGVLLDEVTLEANPQMRTIDSLTMSILVPEFSIIEDMLSMHDASLLVQYEADQWYAETEMKLLVFNKFVCRAAFSLPRPGVPGSLTFQNTETSFTLKEFLEGIGVAVADDVPIIEGVLDGKISKVTISCENDGASFKLTKVVTVLEKRTLTVGSINLYNLEVEVCYANIQGHSSVSLSLQGYLNPKTHASLAYNAEKRELIGRYVFMENISTSECLNELFDDEVRDSSSNAFDQVKSLHVQEVKVVLSFSREKNWTLKEFALTLEGTLSLGPIRLKRLRLEYVKDQADSAKRHISVVGHFKSEDLMFTMELSCTGQQSKSTIFEAVIRPDSPGGVTLSSLLQLTGLMKPEVPQLDGSPNFLEIELQEALLQFEVSPFRIRKADVVVKTTETLKILEKPVIQVHEARLEYHFDDTSDPDRTKTFIAGVFIIANVRLDIKLRKDTTGRLVLEGQLQYAGNIDFEQAAEQLSPDVPFSLPKNVSLTSFLFKLERGEETTLLKLEGQSQTNWHINAGFSEITVENLGGKLKFEKDRMSDAWTGFVCLTGKVLLVEGVVVAVEVYHDSKGETLAFGTVYEPEKIDLDVLTQRFAVGSDSSKSWNELVPGETESPVRSPKFNSASLFINVSSKTLFFYGNVVGLGTGLLMVKKTDGNENSTEYGFLFGLNLGSDFRFSSLNKRLSVVDEILSVQQANLSVISMEHLTVEEMRKDFSKLQGIEHKQQEVDSPFTDIDIQTTSKVQVRSGVTAFAKQTDKSELISTSEALRMISPGRYKIGVRAQGSINKLHSAYADADILVVIMNAPFVNSIRHRPAVTVQWNPVGNSNQGFSSYVISYLQPEAESEWNHVEVEMSATEMTIEDLQPDSEYLFCISVASFGRGRGIRSPPTPVYTDFDVILPETASNLLDNPNFKPAIIGQDEWEDQGYTHNIVTKPWKKLIQPQYRHYSAHSQYRVETVPKGTDDWPDHDDSNPSWCIAAAGNGRGSAWRFQIIDLLDKGLTAEYLDEAKPDIEVFEWFAVKRGCSGAYDIKVSLLDSYKRDLTGRNFFLDCKKLAPSDGSWERLSHTFANYPRGLRFIRFEDGMQCLDDSYVVKAFGATVKISESPGKDEKYSEDCERAVNEQINLELYASYGFLAMSCCKYDDPAVDDVAVPGLNELLSNQSDMCFSHAQMFKQYQRDRRGDIVLQDIKKPEPDKWGTALEACAAAVEIAGEVNDSLLNMRRLARKKRDHHLVDFISANLLHKQVESVHALSYFLTKLNRAAEAEGYGD